MYNRNETLQPNYNYNYLYSLKSPTNVQPTTADRPKAKKCPGRIYADDQSVENKPELTNNHCRNSGHSNRSGHHLKTEKPSALAAYAVSQNHREEEMSSKASHSSASFWARSNKNYEPDLETDFLQTRPGFDQKSPSLKSSTQSEWFDDPQKQQSTNMQKVSVQSSNAFEDLSPNQFMKVQSSQNFYTSPERSPHYQQERLRHESGNGNYPNRNYAQNRNRISVQQSCTQYLQWLCQSLERFEQRGSIESIKEINSSNRQKAQRLFDNLQMQKKRFAELVEEDKKIASESGRFTKSIQKAKARSEQQDREIFSVGGRISELKKEKIDLLARVRKEKLICSELKFQEEEQMGLVRNQGLDESRIREENHLSQMQETVKELEHEIRQITVKNQEMSQNLQTLPFFREWNMMFEEAKGARKLTVKLRDEIAKREASIKAHSKNIDKDTIIDSEKGEEKQQSLLKRAFYKTKNQYNNSNKNESLKTSQSNSVSRIETLANKPGTSAQQHGSREHSRENVSAKTNQNAGNPFMIHRNLPHHLKSPSNAVPSANFNRVKNNHLKPGSKDSVIIRHLSHSSRMSESKKPQASELRSNPQNQMNYQVRHKNASVDRVPKGRSSYQNFRAKMEQEVNQASSPMSRFQNKGLNSSH